MGPTQVRDYCQVDEIGRQRLAAATPALVPQGSAGASVRQMNLSAQAYHRAFKLARTIAGPSTYSAQMSMPGAPPRPMKV